MDSFRTIYSCRACHSANLTEVLNLGNQYLGDYFPATREQGERDCVVAPLRMVICDSCSLVQLGETVTADNIFRDFYYRSNVTQTMRDALAEIVHTSEDFVKLSAGDAVCDIGSNDSTLLRFYGEGIKRVGFEPALNFTEEGSQGGITVIPDYFHYIPEWHGKFKVISAISMFYDVDSPAPFLDDVRQMLHPDGVFVVQFNYLLSMLKDCAFDNTGHGHLCYYTLTSLLPLLERAGLHVHGVSLNSLNGGCIRIWCKPVPRHVQPFDMTHLLLLESTAKITSKETYEQFTQRIAETKKQVLEILASHPKNKIYLCGASTRGNTLLQTFGIDHRMVAGAGERDERKHGRVTPGTWIQIVSEEEARAKAEIMLVLPWHFRIEICSREASFLSNGGKLLFPLPKPELVEATTGAYVP